MSRLLSHITLKRIAVLSLVALLTPSVFATSYPTLETRRRLLENQRNIYRLRQEQDEMREELRLALRRQQQGDKDPGLGEEIDDIEDSIATADVIVKNINDVISRQRLLLSTLERGSAPSTLDMALHKALNANLSQLAKNLADNDRGRQDVVELRNLLKQQAGLGERHIETPSAVSYAAEQQQAEDEYLHLLELVSNKSDDKRADKPVTVTGQVGDKPVTEVESLSYLGHAQYHMETRVHSGKMTFTVDGRPWQINIAPKDDKATYIVIYDASKADHPRLVMFNKALLLE